MALMKVLCVLTLALQTSYLAVSARDTSQSTSASIFTYPLDHKIRNLTFALSLGEDESGAFHLSGPSSYSWIAVGTGSRMEGSTMFITYSDGSQNGAAFSTRTATGHNEPTYQAKNRIRWTAVNENGLLSVNATCQNCTSLFDEETRSSRAARPFIFALGPQTDGPHNGSPQAMIQRHVLYGSFTMDLSQAMSDVASVPLPSTLDASYTAHASSSAEDVNRDHDWGATIHAVVMSIAFMLLFPLGALLLRFLDSVKIHAWMQTLGVLLVVIGLGSGIYISREYTSTQSFQSPHQIIGIVASISVVIQLSLGLINHVSYKKTGRKSSFGLVHLILGPATIVLGIINVPLGLNLAQESHFNVTYGIVLAILAALFIMARIIIWSHKARGGQVKQDDDYLHNSLRRLDS